MAQVHAYVALPLTPTQETALPNSTGYGSVTALYNAATKALTYSAVYQMNPGASATASHFHGSAALGANAPVEIPLPTQPIGNSGKLVGSVTLNATQKRHSWPETGIATSTALLHRVENCGHS